jgi:hypothetical protein
LFQTSLPLAVLPLLLSFSTVAIAELRILKLPTIFTITNTFQRSGRRLMQLLIAFVFVSTAIGIF